MKKRILGISGVISFAIFLILLLVSNSLGKSQLSQQMAQRWSDEGDVAQVSCFFSVDANITQDGIEEFEHSIDSALAEASVLQTSENPSARLWADAYSADGTISLSSEKSSIEADAIGIGGDFFLFHPLTLVSGYYFSGNDLMQDYCVIDRDAAWQLFGATDVSGMIVYIRGIPHIISGVVERPTGRLAEAAGLDKTLVYVSYETLEKLGKCNGINHYEIVMPNPVTGFAEDFIRKNLGRDAAETEVVENTSRYSFLSRLRMITQFGTRSMNGKAIIYPYWENIARGYEDILVAITAVDMLFLIYAVVIALVLFISWWRHKGWTIKGLLLIVKDKLERLGERLRAKRLENKESVSRHKRRERLADKEDADNRHKKEKKGLGLSRKRAEDNLDPK